MHLIPAALFGLALAFAFPKANGNANLAFVPAGMIVAFLLKRFYSAWRRRVTTDPKNRTTAPTIIPQDSIFRQNAIRRASDLILPDAIYEITHFNDLRSPHECEISLQELNSDEPVEVLNYWRDKSRKLRNEAYRVGNAGLRRDGSYEQAEAQLYQDNPGFGEESYQKAITYGYQQAR